MTDQLEAGGVDVAPEHRDPAAPDSAIAPEPGATRVSWRERRRARPSKWDRPPDPHDWRYFVGTLGKILIATGLLLFGFVGYQLYGTGIETARAQNRLEDDFARLVAANMADRDPTVTSAPGVSDADDADDADDQLRAATDDGDGAATGADASGDPGDPVDAGDADGGDDGFADAAGSITTIPPAIDLSDEAVEQRIPPIRRGDVMARLQIPAIDQDVYVVPGVRLTDLKDGPGHYPDTPLPGQLGNASIAGHRTTYGAPFFDVDQLRPGDEIIVTMITGDRFVYLVTGTEIVSAADYWVVTTGNPDIAELTLTSCDPKYTARDRIVVHSVLDPSRSSNVGLPTSYELDEPADEADDTAIPGDDPTVVVDDPAAPADDSVTAPAAPADDPSAPGDQPADEPSAPAADEPRPSGPADEPDVADREVDAFSQGWFDDGAAFPQIALWGLVLTAISLAAYALSRRTRHDWIGGLVGIAPFVVALYFFFQNVNRLLPPGL